MNYRTLSRVLAGLLLLPSLMVSGVVAAETAWHANCFIQPNRIIAYCRIDQDLDSVRNLQSILEQKGSSQVEREIYFPKFVDIVNRARVIANGSGKLADQAQDAISALNARDVSRTLALFEAVYLANAVNPNDKEVAKLSKELAVLAYLQNSPRMIEVLQLDVLRMPDDVEGWLMLGLALERSGGDLERACLNALAAHRRQSVSRPAGKARGARRQLMRIYFLLAEFYRTRQQYDQADQWYKLSIETRPRNRAEAIHADSYSGLGKLGLLREEYDQAEKYFHEALALNETLVANELSTINQALAAGNVFAANAAFVINRNSRRHRYMRENYYSLGLVYSRQNLPDRADHMFKIAYGLSLENDQLFADIQNQLSLIRTEYDRRLVN